MVGNFDFFSAAPQKLRPPVLTKAVRSGRSALTVNWTTPQSERPITKYQVQYSRTGTTIWSTRDVRSNLRSLTLENLSTGTNYQVQVRAVSDVGSGPFSNVKVLFTYRGKLLELVKHACTQLCTYIFLVIKEFNRKIKTFV